MKTFYAIHVLFFGSMCVQACIMMADETYSRPDSDRIVDERTDDDRFDVRSRTRFGVERFGKMPDKIEYPNARFSGGLRFGRNNRFYGIDSNDPSSRFHETEQTPQLLPSEYLAENPSLKKREEVGSANRRAPADVAGSQSFPIRRPVGFFDRPDVAGSMVSGTEESLRMDKRKERWLRQFGPGVETSSSGLAVAVGGEEALRQPRPMSEADLHRQQPQRTGLPNPAASKRKFEEKLEGMLLTNPAVHLLSPVQVSFENGIATVRGIVANKTDKISVGTILLNDPVVKQVNNLVTVVPIDGTLPPIEPK